MKRLSRCSRARRLATAFLSVLGATLAGCTAISGPARVENFQTPTAASFPGLLPSANDRVSNRYIFQIHGINTPNPDWGENLLSKIAHHGYIREKVPGTLSCTQPDADPNTTQSKFCNPAKLKIIHIVSVQGLTCGDQKPAPCVYDRFGIYEKDVFTNSKTGDRITVYTYFWRGDLWRITGHFLRADIDANNTNSWSPNTRKSLFNAMLKAGLVDNGLSDAAGYLSDIGSLEREGVESTLCAMFADAIGTPQSASVLPGAGCLDELNGFNHLDPTKVEFNFLSHSLGSRMLYDVLSPYDPEKRTRRLSSAIQARSFIVNSTRTFFMAANQLPLLAVSGVKITDQTQPLSIEVQEASQPAANFLSLRAPAIPDSGQLVPQSAPTMRVQVPELVVVAFQDPDDLLGFKASDVVMGDTDPKINNVRFVDVLHRNTDQWLYLFSNPLKAHDNELSEPNSLKMVLCGAEADASGNLKANAC